MLNELLIENIAVIEKADISFKSGFNVLTGETGAGKSIIIDSIQAVLGGKAGKELIRRNSEKAFISAIFDSSDAKEWLEKNDIEADDELIIQRRISIDGKSTCRVCGVPVSVSQLKELGACLVDIYGQNDGRKLLDESSHLSYLDLFSDLQSELTEYKELYKNYRSIKNEIEKSSKDELEREYLFQKLKTAVSELELLDTRNNEYSELKERRDLLRNSEKLSEYLKSSLEIINGDNSPVSRLEELSYFLSKASAYAPDLSALTDSISNVIFSLSDVSEQIIDFADILDFSPDEYDALEERISKINRVLKKYGISDDSIEEYIATQKNRLYEIEHHDENIEKLKLDLSDAEAECRKKAEIISQKRKKSAKILEKRIEDELKALNMPSVKFFVGFTKVKEYPGFGSNGSDNVAFMICANSGGIPGKINRIASGGELSRIMLAMKNVFAGKDPVSTMIFDEIDTGVSGVAAQRVGEKLFAVSQGKQVLCVTHLSQIAALADNHLLISKHELTGNTFTIVETLDTDGRINELARLHGGDIVDDRIIEGAKAQLKYSDSFKNNLMEDIK